MPKKAWNKVDNRVPDAKKTVVYFDGHSDTAAMDLSTPQSAQAFFRDARAKVAANGMELRSVMATSGFQEIKRGLPGRDEKIAYIINAIRAMGAAGVPILAYNFKLLMSKYLRSRPTQGRGGASYISFAYEEYLKKPAPPVEPPLSERQMLDNIAHLSR